MAHQDPPIFHIHVKVIAVDFKDGAWYALFREPNGEEVWMNQPCEMEIGSEQILYIVKQNTPEFRKLERLSSRGINPEKYLERIAKQYGVWCERTWDEIIRDRAIH